jgi:glycosyltransferase involved in cell wall biosynthesis
LSLRNLDEKKIKVSVIIAAYNSEKYIDYAIQSIKKQEYKKW